MLSEVKHSQPIPPVVVNIKGVNAGLSSQDDCVI